MSDIVADALDDAADYLERHGWVQGRSASGERRCAMGAICVATNTDLTQRAAYRALHRVPGISEWGSITAWNDAPITAWNDAPERSIQDVLDAFRAAAKAERMGGAA